MDSNDRERISEVKEELWRMLLDEEGLKDAALLVMANKQDLPNAMSVAEIAEKLEIDKIKDRKICKSDITSRNLFDSLFVLLQIFKVQVAEMEKVYMRDSLGFKKV